MSTKQSPPVTPAELARLPEFHHPIVSPDGEAVAFYYDETGRNELYVLDRETWSYEQWSDGEVPRDARWHLLWGPDGDRVYFHRDDAGDEQNDVLAVGRDGSVETVAAVDGQAILTDVSNEGDLVLSSDEGEQLNVYRQDVQSGERHQLTEYDRPTSGAILSPDDDRIAYVTNESESLENRDVYVADADGSDPRRLAIGEDGSESAVWGWFPDGERLLVDDNAHDLRQVGVYDLGSDEIEWLGPREAGETAQGVSPDGRYVLVERARRGATMPVVYDLDAGEGRELDVPEGVVNFPVRDVGTFVDDRTAVFAHSASDERKQLYEYDLATDESRVLLEAEYEDVDPDTFVEAEYVTYESDGSVDEATGISSGPDHDPATYDIGAILYDPREGPGRDEDEQDVPGVVVVHGGPHGRSKKEFDLVSQFLVSQGYAVLRPNYRGSIGRGREFKQAILGDWGGSEQADVAEGGRWLMDRDWIDEERVAVFGGSYGGYSTYVQLVTYPELWATGVAWVGITDLHALYEEDMPHFQYTLRQQMGDPEDKYDLWRERSPVEHVDSLQRPLLIVHGINDSRCPISQARIFREALEDRGWEAGPDFEYEELEEEGHGSSDIDQKIRTFELLADYLDRRL